MQHSGMQCGRGQSLNQIPCRQMGRAPAGVGSRRTMRVMCEFGSNRSSWELQSRVSNVRHATEQIFHKIGDAVRTSPPVTAANRALEPVRRNGAAQLRKVAYVWDDFTSEETKRQWTWSRQREQEARFWKDFALFLGMVIFTIVYEAIVPVSLVWGVLGPLFISWALYDRLVYNPIMVGLMIILPYKFIPGAPFRLL